MKGKTSTHNTFKGYLCRGQKFSSSSQTACNDTKVAYYFLQYISISLTHTHIHTFSLLFTHSSINIYRHAGQMSTRGSSFMTCKDILLLSLPLHHASLFGTITHINICMHADTHIHTFMQLLQ